MGKSVFIFFLDKWVFSWPLSGATFHASSVPCCASGSLVYFVHIFLSNCIFSSLLIVPVCIFSKEKALFSLE